MLLTLAVRSLLTRPVRSAVLAAGFGLGVSVMAALLGIGGVILEQSRAPELFGGGDVIVSSSTGRLRGAKFVLSTVLGSGPLASRVTAASPTSRATLFLIDGSGSTGIRARGGIPSVERALNDPETSQVTAWTDTPADRAWAAPDPETVLREMDRFHPMPDVPARASSWAEWLYFNGRSSAARFYLTFLAGPPRSSGRRTLGVRLQLEQEGQMRSYSDSAEVDAAALLATAPEISVGASRVRLVGQEYRITLDLPGTSGSGRLTADIVVRAVPGRSLLPFAIQGAGGWMSGYVVPVMAGELSGTIHVGDRGVDLSGGTAYHDHNWGFWEGVSWRWGQVQASGLSFVYGRVHPPADAADESRLPGFLAAIGPDGPIGYATDVSIEELDRSGSGMPERIVVRGRSESLDLTLDLSVEQATVTPMRQGSFGGNLKFLQLRANYHVSGELTGRDVDFRAPGSAETFR